MPTFTRNRTFPPPGKTIAFAIAVLFVTATYCSMGAWAQAQRFQNPPMLTTPLDPAEVISGDWNGDGHQDLIYVEESLTPTLHVLLGNGSGAFNESTPVTLPPGSCSFENQICKLVAADFNGDGKTDLLMGYLTSSSYGLLLLPGLGNGLFGTPILSTFPLGDNIGSPFSQLSGAVADLDNNGTLDIAIANDSTDSIVIYSGDGQGHFAPVANTLSDPNRPAAIYSADVNHDGFLDLVVLDVEGGIGAEADIWLGNGALGFTISKRYQNPPTPFFGDIVTDLNGDGNVDIVGSDRQGTVKIETGNPDGTFHSPQIIGSGIAAGARILSAVDLNGDGLKDLIVSDPNGFATLVAKSSLAYGAPQIRTSGPFLMTPFPADFNEDGITDFAEGVIGGIHIFLGNRQGSFPDSTFHAATLPLLYSLSGDFNGDGIADVAAIDANGDMQTFLGSQTTGFRMPVQSNTAFNIPAYTGANLVGDFDGDGKQDILLGIGYNQQNLGTVLYGNGDGTFTAAAGPYSPGPLVADLNNDGRSDSVYITLGAQSPVTFEETYEFVSLLGQANRTFTQVTTSFAPHFALTNGSSPVILGAKDMNGDGIADVVVYDPTEPALEVWLGKGDGTFRLYTSLDITQNGIALLGGGQSNLFTGAVGDLDGDGHADAAMLSTRLSADAAAGPEYVVVIEYGDGKGGFTGMQLLTLTHPYSTFALAALDKSGRPGFVVSDGSLIGVIRNLGPRAYSQEAFYGAGFLAGVNVADFNGDGDSDLLAIRQYQYTNFISESTPGFTVLLNEPAENAPGTGEVNGTITANPGSVNYYQPFTLTATLLAAPQGAPTPSGVIDFSGNGIDFGSVTLQSGVATLQVPASVTQTLPPGDLLITASYSGNAYYASSDLAANLVVLNPVYATSTVLQLTAGGVAASVIQAGSFVTLTALVNAAQTVPRGIVAFYDGSKVLGQAPLGQTFSTNLLSPGAHLLSAQYLGYVPETASQGTASFTPSVSAGAPLTVAVIATTASLTSSTALAASGTVVTLTAVASSASGKPIGDVTFFDGTTVLGSQSLDANATCSLSTVMLATGQHSLTAVFSANGIYAQSASAPVVVTVTAASGSRHQTTTLLNSITPGSAATPNQAVIQVTGLHGEALTLTGNVSILVDGLLATTAAMPASGSLLQPLRLSPGSHTLYASYSGDAQAAPSATQVFVTTSYGSGPDFALSGESGSSIHLSVRSIGNWSQAVSLRCAAGVPPGYTCIFSPHSVPGSGSVLLTLQPASSLGQAVFFLTSGIAFAAGMKRRRWLAGLLLTVLALAFAGCGGSVATSTTHPVLTIEASSGSVIHSAQVAIKGFAANE